MVCRSPGLVVEEVPDVAAVPESGPASLLFGRGRRAAAVQEQQHWK